MTRSHSRLISLWDMLELPIGRLIWAYQKVSTTSQMLAFMEAQKKEPLLDEFDYQELLQQLEEFRDRCADGSLTVTHRAAIRMCEEARKATRDADAAWTWDQGALLRFKNALDQAIGCLRYETTTKAALILQAEKLPLYEQAEPLFGPQVAGKFPGLSYEIAEAGKCLALGRTTASAFHTIRCLEAGFAAVWRSLGVPDPIKGYERNWTNRLNKINAQLEARWPSSTGRMNGDAKFFDEVIGTFTSMQNPYRNSTMHLDAVYTEEDALGVLQIVKGLMRKIASRMDENGLPLA